MRCRTERATGRRRAVALEELRRGPAPPSPPGGSTPRRSGLADAAYANERSIPATSRSGLRLRRRSGSERAGSPSKSRITQSSSAHERLPEVEVAVVADHASDAAEVRQHAQPLAHLLAAPADRIELGDVVGQVEEHRSISSSTVAVSSPSDSTRGLLGREARVVRVGAEHRVHARRHLAEPARAARGSLRCRRASCRARAPSRRRPATNRWRMPSVASIGRPAYAYQPASCAMFAKPCSVRKRSSSSSGLIPASSRRNTFRISSSSNTIELFDCSASIGRASRSSCRAAKPSRPRRTRRRRRPAGSLIALPHHRHELAQRSRGAVERVERVVGEQLVHLVRPRVEADLDEQQLERAARPRAGPRGRRPARARRPSSSSRTSAGW